MGAIQIVTIDCLTDASGDFTIKTPNLFGYFHQVIYDFGSIDNTADITMVGVKTGMDIFNPTNLAAADAVFLPRHAICDQNGSALEYDGTEPIVDRVILNEQFVFTCAQGGNAQQGQFHFFIAEQ
jgi:hypothetical protein